MASQKPFYKHTSILLAIAFVAGIGVGGITDSLNAGQGNASIIQNSAFVRSIGKGKNISMESVGKILAYSVSDGAVMNDYAGDAEDADSVKPAEPVALPIPEVEKNAVVGPELPGPVDCVFDAPKKVVHKATPMTASQSFSAGEGDLIRVSMVYKNDGNTPWFSDAADCKDGPVVQLGTTRELDRESVFYNGDAGSGWAGKNRVYLRTPRVNPGEQGIFSFDMQVPTDPDLYREYFSMMIPGVKWMDKAESFINIEVGEPYDKSTFLQKMDYLNSSVGAKVIDLSAVKNIDADLSSQRMRLKVGDYIIRDFPMSSGSPKHPTPTGSWTVVFKQKVRIGGESPFYIMPFFQGLSYEGRSFSGFGFHALPSLGNATLRAKIRALAPGEAAPTEWFTSDSMWSEALDHIGSPRSHGCMRLLPNDAAYLDGFTEAGTPVVVHA